MDEDQDSLLEFLKALQIRNQQLAAELEFIKQSRGYRFLERLKSSRLSGLMLKLVRWSMPGYIPPSPPGEAQEIVTRLIGEEINQFDQQKGIKGNQAFGKKRDVKDEEWVVHQRMDGRPVSINHPDWRGVLASATELFGNVFTIPDDLDEETAQYYAELLRDAAPPSITIQGFPLTYYRLVKALRKAAPQIPIYVIWHGNFLHMPEDVDWEGLRLVKALYQEGDIKKVGFVKKGMEEVLGKVIDQSYFIMNLIRQVPSAASVTYQDRIHVGLWAQPDWNWKKLPYAMLASLALIDGCKGHVFNVSPRAQEVGEFLKIDAEYLVADFISRAEALEIMAKMHVNLYVTLTECAPMMPLESLSLGSPCLLGPTSHYFLDHEYLHNRLVVPSPDNPTVIARMIAQAVAERATIIDAYQEYAPGYNQRALDSLELFLEFPVKRNS